MEQKRSLTDYSVSECFCVINQPIKTQITSGLLGFFGQDDQEYIPKGTKRQ
jgi:hypothetical protein